ncbi:hypothetical protein QJS04_geneDACA016396 [Acorus gramineus]|uniref:Guanylate kinase 1 n=1 Tax=Acorus gramineus TaxID=55184 RepID=A0AAV9AQK6_ACOGR|nr:hypothetical protein QJS04_geneDACA016396 [Acorus gramineus]
MREEAPEFSHDGFHCVSPIELDSKSLGCQTTTIVGEKIFVVGGPDDGEGSCLSVRVFDKSTGKWSVPTILGTKPLPCKGHSAVLLNNDRILILKQDALPDDCTWFLEVDSPFVRDQKKILETEVVAWSKGVKGDGLKPVVISGPSGVGKGTLISKLMNEFPHTFGFSVSHTTRAPRKKEKHGVHYHFTDQITMEKDIREGKFLESAQVHGNLYGTSIEAVEAVTDSGKRCILDIDVQGARSVKASLLDVMSIFICPPSYEDLEKRLRARGTETEEQVQKRLRNATAELEQGKSSGLFDHILVNDDLETCYQNLKTILGLNESSDASNQTSMEGVECSTFQSLTEKNQKVLIHYNSNSLESKTLFVLDVSSLKGGAPGRTRGLSVYAINPFTYSTKGILGNNKEINC